jgi:hypothetical protein
MEWGLLPLDGLFIRASLMRLWYNTESRKIAILPMPSINDRRGGNSFSKSNALWPWLFPITYLAHIAEEYGVGEGYPAYLLRLRDIHLSPEGFLALQAVGLVLMIIGIPLARQLQFPRQLTVTLGSVVLVNGLIHAFMSLVYIEYVPGLFTSIVLWIPLGAVSLVMFKSEMRHARYWICFAMGVVVNIMIELAISKGGVLF